MCDIIKNRQTPRTDIMLVEAGAVRPSTKDVVVASFARELELEINGLIHFRFYMQSIASLLEVRWGESLGKACMEKIYALKIENEQLRKELMGDQ